MSNRPPGRKDSNAVPKRTHLGNRDSLSANAVSAASREANTSSVPYQVDEKMLSELNVRLSNDEAVMQDMERDFQIVIKDLTGNESLGRFRLEYEKLHAAIKMAHENEMKLMGKCRNLHAEIVANSTRITTATRLAQEDQVTIQALKKEIEKAWKMLDEAHEREDKAGETVTMLKMEIANLTRLVEKNASFATGQEQNAQDFLRAKEKMTAERDDFVVKLEQAQQELVDSKNKITKVERNLEEANKERISLLEQLAERKDEASKEEKHRSKMERELKRAKAEIEDAKEEESRLQVEITKNEAMQNQLRQQLREYKTDLDRTKADLQALDVRQRKLQSDYDSQLASTEEMKKENAKIKSEMDNKEAEFRHMQFENQKLVKANDQVHKKITHLESLKAELEIDREAIKRQALDLEKWLESQRIQANSDRKMMEDLLRERDNMKHNLDKQNNDGEKLETQIVTARLEKHALELEIQRYEQEAMKSRRLLGNLEQERDKNAAVLNALRHEVLEITTTLNDKESKIKELKRQNDEADSKTQTVRNQLETMRTERNILSKSVTDANDDIESYKRRLNIMNDQMEHLRDQITKVEAAIAKEHLERHRIETERDTLRSELTLLKKKTMDIEKKLTDVETEQIKLVRIIKHADDEKDQMLKEVQRITRERDILGTQVIRRNDELTLLSEKLRILELIMEKGEGAYKARLDDIRVLKLELQRLSREKGIMARNASSMDEMRAEIYRLNKDLLGERNHCRILEEELRVPANAHRWRALQGNDPSTYELILKIQTYQRRLIKKTDEVIQIDQMLQEKENLYLELKTILTKLPNQEVHEKIIKMQKALQDKTKQMRGLTADVNMYNTMWSEEKILNERLIRDIDEYKTQYFRMRKMMDRNPADDAVRVMMKDSTYPGIAPAQRITFYGGGYKTKDEPATKNGLTVTIYPVKKAKERPKSQEITRSKDTNLALVNLAFPTRPAIKEIL